MALNKKTVKCLGISLTEELQNLHSENYKTLLKAIKEDLNQWKHGFINLTQLFLELCECVG